MAKNQAKQETEDTEPWVAEDSGDFDEPANATDVVPVKTQMAMRHKIEDLMESRRLQAQIGDYEFFDVDDEKPRRLH